MRRFRQVMNVVMFLCSRSCATRSVSFIMKGNIDLIKILTSDLQSFQCIDSSKIHSSFVLLMNLMYVINTIHM
jgi:hypothetical protein